MERSEAERRAAQPPADQAETEGKRPNVLAASQRDREETLSRREQAKRNWKRIGEVALVDI